jgi:hypothetical protein
MAHPRRLFGSALIALAVAGAAASLGYARFRAQRLSNLVLSGSDFAPTYLVLSHSDPEGCYVVGRQGSTMRRSDAKQPGSKWQCLRIHGGPGSAAESWLLVSKRKQIFLLVPALEVPDWGYVFLYDFVRRQRPQLELPEVSWTELYVERVYQGLYLRVGLPFDPRKKDGGTGLFRELLTVDDGRLAVVNTRFRDDRGVYATAVANAAFPTLAPPDPALAWLARRAPTRATTFLLSSQEPYTLSLLPLPLSLPAWFERLYGRAPLAYEDARYEEWTGGSWRAQGERSPFTEPERQLLEAELGRYATGLRAALRAQGAVDLALDRVEGAFLERQRAVADLAPHDRLR